MTQFPAFVNEALGGPTVRGFLYHVPLVRGIVDVLIQFIDWRQAKTDAWWLHLAMVRRDFQGQGVAKALINLVVDKVRVHSAHPIQVLLIFPYRRKPKQSV